MIELSRPGKTSLVLDNPVIIAAGMMGFDASPYRNLLKVEKLGAMVTAPLSWKARGPARGSRVMERGSNILLHTGLPNPGIRKVISNYKDAWRKSPVPIIVHLMDSNPPDLHTSARQLDGIEGVVAVEIGLREDVDPDEIEQLVKAVRTGCELPILVKLPLYNAPWLAQFAEGAGADALVIASPPRGTDRDVVSRHLFAGRLYGPYLKPLALRAVGQTASLVKIPIIGCGGIHTADDARDFLDAGARAIQLDTVLWVSPSDVEIIARNLGGLELTRAVGALFDEWEPGIGNTVMMKRKHERDESVFRSDSDEFSRPDQSRPMPPMPPAPPEMPLGDGDDTRPAESEDWF